MTSRLMAKAPFLPFPLLLMVAGCSETAVIATHGDGAADGAIADTGGDDRAPSDAPADASGADAGADAGACPAQLPIGGGACTGSATCTYGTATCCGITSSAYTCPCQNGHFACYMTVECNFVCPPPPGDAAADAADAAPPADAAGDATPDGPRDAAAADAAPPDGGATCGTTSCAAGDVCVRRLVQGGTCNMPDAGVCPTGTTLVGSCCQNGPTYHCAARPAACGATLTCACAASSLCDPAFSCNVPAATGDELDCTQFTP